jgi:hypothetical protein
MRLKIKKNKIKYVYEKVLKITLKKKIKKAEKKPI